MTAALTVRLPQSMTVYFLNAFVTAALTAKLPRSMPVIGSRTIDHSSGRCWVAGGIEHCVL